ncbi:hypothetical protein P9112_007234 [Eukaryota sp. TZLM1-RC]
MRLYLSLLLLVALAVADSSRLWPTPKHSSFGDRYIRLSTDFTFVSNVNIPILGSAFERYTKHIRSFSLDAESLQGSPTSTVQRINVNVRDSSADLSYGVDESYEIIVSFSSIEINAKTAYGAMSALETFSQLVELNPQQGSHVIRAIPLTISDSPRWPWRGLLIDTARHYLPINTIKRVIDAMTYSKLNVLHMHWVDAQSFPLVVPSVPELSREGSFCEDLVYTPDMVREITKYANERGIRVVGEIDMPGHAFSWGYGIPEIISQCPSRFHGNVNSFPLDPSKNKTFEVIEKIASDVAGLFNDAYIHLGADEPNFRCWTEYAPVAKWMKEQGFKDGGDVYRYFWSRALPIFKQFKTILWQEAVLLNAQPPKSSIIHVWEGLANVKKVVAQGYDILTSAGFYLDRQQPTDKERYGFIDTWKDMFEVEPTDGLTTEEISKLKGGEAAMWGEAVDTFSIESRIWPRALAVSERLWHQLDTSSPIDWNAEAARLEKQRCRMAGRGVEAGPIVPGPVGVCKFTVPPFMN